MTSIQCPHCGASFSSRHGASIHRVRCRKNPDRKVWSRSGVKNGTAKPRVRHRPAIDGEPTSECCVQPVRTGKPHANGNRYCTGCGEPCFWYANRPLPTVWSCKTAHCDSVAHWRDGYCKRCYDSRNKRAARDLDEEDDAAMM